MKDYKEKLKKLIQRIENSIVNGRIDEKVDKAILKNFIVESEDEKIRKALIQYFSEQDGILTAINGNVSVGDILAWLEKQKERGPLSKDEEYTLARIIEYLEDNGCPSKWKDLLYDVYALPYQKERKPADKVETKCKIEKGKWYVCDTPCYADFIVGKAYFCPKNGMLKPNEIKTARFVANDCFHLWTIQDAKDGDVLCGYSTSDYPWIGIFNELNGEYTFKSYCFLQAGINGKFCPPSGVNIFGKRNVDEHNSEIMVPATKEQSELLFQKMKEAGYEWDAEKKELKKIKQTYFQKQEWTGYDEKAYEIALLDIDKSPSITKNDTIDWLKSLKNRVQPQPKQEWSEEDKKHLLGCISYFTGITEYSPYYKDFLWLKSLKERYIWKPSDEQMDAVKSAALDVAKFSSRSEQLRLENELYYKALISLYNDLKKLREEI